jgi:hypothetical protein
MDTKRFVIGTLAGGIVMYFVGYIIFGQIFADFYATNAGSEASIYRETNLVWAIALGTFSLAALVTFVIGKSAGSPTISDGLKAGATVGFLVWFGVDFIHYGAENISNLTATIADPLLEIVRTGIGGAVIAAVLGKLK